MKQLPLGISDFKQLRQNDYLYIDKTKQIHAMIHHARFNFLARPRRFGKSLLISTLRELFSGNKDLFKGLWIEAHSDYAWTQYSVIHLDFSTFSAPDYNSFMSNFNTTLNLVGQQFGIDVKEYESPELKITVLIKELAKNKEVVLLVDEYDYPILKHITNPAVVTPIHESLKDFYAALKGITGLMRAIFLTGVSKFSKTSIFSGMNNLNDLSLDPRAADLLGYTREEIDSAFTEPLKELAHKEELSYQALMQKIAQWYNGYRFSEDPITVYNPFSIHALLARQKFNNFWFETGTPSFIIKLLRDKQTEITKLQTPIKVSSKTLGAYAIEKLQLNTIFFQAGYLTIKDYDRTEDEYTLGFPNQEVELSLSTYILGDMLNIEIDEVESTMKELKSSILNDNIEKFCSLLQDMLAHIPGALHIPQESYYHSILHITLLLMGMKPNSEINTSKGCIDLVISVKDAIYLFEFKFNASAKKALQQIENRTYYERYLLENKNIALIGLAFKKKDKTISLDYLIKKLPLTSEHHSA